jgi:hypothetical protein
MTRYWPTAMIQLPTAVYMVSEFMNSFRTVFLDGREHSDKDVVVRTPNGESIGHWEGDTMVVDTQFFRGDHHWMDQGGASIPAGEQLHIVERISCCRRQAARDRVHDDRPRKTGLANGRAPRDSTRERHRHPRGRVPSGSQRPSEEHPVQNSSQVKEMTMPRSLFAALVILLVAAAPSFAQVSFVGDWSGRYHEDQPDRVPGEEPGDFSGIPLNDAARRFGDAWDVARHSVLEHQCAPYTLPYMFFGPNQFRIWEERHPDTQELTAIQMFMGTYQQRRTIWMDGRPHPPEYAPHTYMGFSTGEWNGDTLTITTTHIKAGYYRRTGVPQSDRSTVVEHWMRHGNLLSQVTIASDPVYLTEPYIRSQEFVIMERNNTNWLYNCEYAMEVPTDKNEVPHFLPVRTRSSANSPRVTRCRKAASAGALKRCCQAGSPAQSRGAAAKRQRWLQTRRAAVEAGGGRSEGRQGSGQRLHDRWRRREHRRAGGRGRRARC